MSSHIIEIFFIACPVVVNYYYDRTCCNYHIVRPIAKLDPVGSIVHYEVMRLCTGPVYDSNGWYLVVLSQYEAVIEVFVLVENIYAFIY